MNATDAEILSKYGAWLEALQRGAIEPTTDAQRHFVEIFTKGGTIATVYERAWSNYLMERRYVRATAVCKTDYSEARYVMTRLASRGHRRAIQWLRSEGPWDPRPPPDAVEKDGYAKINWDEVRWLNQLVPGSFGG
jgi:hypothetical protein